jgi:hypothetical protein
MVTRRRFLAQGGAATAGATRAARTGEVPWYRRTLRWGQTNITERDPERYDIPFWRAYWKRTRVQGVIINAGGIVAYYPSRHPLHYRAQYLHDRDLFGELTEAAHADGLVVLARMDSNRASEEFYRAHRDWFAVDASGKPYRAADKYVACINSGYYSEYLPEILREIIERSRPEGVTDNSWAGLGRDSICFCGNCARRFRDAAHLTLPKRPDWDDPAFRKWVEWSYARRIEIWELNNRVTKAAGGKDCIWSGMLSGSLATQCRTFRDYREICRRADIVMLDHQWRHEGSFQQNSDAGRLIHGVLGWDKLIPESTALYQAGRQSFRLSAKPAAEVRMWAVEGFAGGIQPWWHHVGAFHEDRRAYKTIEPLMRWHEAHQQYLVNRRPYVTVGVVWSQRNMDYYGRHASGDLVEAPYRGMVQALVKARIPYVPIHADDIERDGADMAVLILPNLAAVSDAQAAALRRYVNRGGSLVATGVSTLYDEWGDRRPDFALADVFRAHAWAGSPEKRWATESYHTYLRLAPEAGWFQDTAILPFGGMLEKLHVEPDATVRLTFIPPFPVYPPETAWMRVEKTDMAALVESTHAAGGRIAFLAADIDRRYYRENLPDHARLLEILIRWAAGGRIPLEVRGRGLLDCMLYRQPGRVILHLVNLVSAGTWRAPIDELTPMGPYRVRVKLPPDAKTGAVRLLVSGVASPGTVKDGWVEFTVPRIEDHEVAVLS